jgi:hypothetical protein
MSQSLNPTSPAGLKLLAALSAAKVGGDVALGTFGSMCPAFGEDCKGRLIETRASSYYEVQVTWFDIPVATVSLEHKRQSLFLEVLK